MVAMYVARGLEWVLARQWRDENKAIIRHFETVTAWEPVRGIMPSFKMVESEDVHRQGDGGKGQERVALSPSS